MSPLGHLALGYLAYAGLRRVRNGGAPSAIPTITLAVGTQFPDIIDKPLSWTFGLLPTGRSLTHSAITTIVVTVVVMYYSRATDRTALGNAFAVGYWSHLLGDLYAAYVAGETETNWFFLWPIVSQEGYVTSPSILAYVETIGWWVVLVLAYIGIFAVAVAVVSERTREDNRAFALLVVVVIATNMWFIYTFVFGSPWVLFELILVQAAVAVWIRDGVPGLPVTRRT